MNLMKIAWTHGQFNADGKGRLQCPCGNAPASEYNPSQGNITCACGTVYTWNGWIVKKEAVA